jgi:hypothetical protein
MCRAIKLLPERGEKQRAIVRDHNPEGLKSIFRLRMELCDDCFCISPLFHCGDRIAEPLVTIATMHAGPFRKQSQIRAARLNAMTPGARLAAAIEILNDVLVRRRAADSAASDWARANRFAGSGDRRAIDAHVYTVLRRRNDFAAAMDGHDDARALVLGSLRLEGIGAVQANAMMTDGPHAPGALSVGELALFDGQIPASAAPWVRLNYPEWLHPELERSLGPNFEAEMDAMLSRAALDLRSNALKTDRDRAKAALALEGIETDA